MNNWTEVTIWTSTAGIDAVTGMLMDLGIDGFVIEDSQDFEDFLHDTEIYWDYVDEKLSQEKKDAETNVKIYVEDSPAGAEMLAQVNAGLAELRARDTEKAFGRCVTELASIRQEDWENNWKQYFKPFRVGETFLIKPSWEQCEPEEGRRILEIDPSSSFGTGTHNTTQLCICELERLVKPGARLLDMGCGSGILSVAGLLLGAGSAVGVDIDALAVKTAVANAEINHVGDRFTGICGNLADKVTGTFDVVVANIVADVVILLTKDAPRFMKPDTVYIMSGIIDTREDDVLACLADKFEIIDRKEEKGWVALAAKLK